MALTHDVRPFSPQRRESFGPQALFAAALMLAAAAWVFGGQTFAADLTLPIVATLLFVLAAGVALMAWRRGAATGHRLTYWDVAGALTFIGIGTAALIEPEQMLRLVATAPGDIEGVGSRR